MNVNIGTSLIKAATVLVIPLLATPICLALSAPKKNINLSRVTRMYKIQAGDTLSKISLRLFGDASSWKSMWKPDRTWVSSPDQVKAGQILYFTPGDLTHLPGIITLGTLGTLGTVKTPKANINLKTKNQVDQIVLSHAGSIRTPIRDTISKTVIETAPNGVASKDEQYPWKDELSPDRSQDWKELPRQAWESVVIQQLPIEQVDPLGFDRSSKITFHEPKGLEAPFAVATEPLLSVGEITSSPAMGRNLILGELIQISADSDLALGQVYSIVHAAYRLNGYYASRDGFSYPIAGKIKVVGNGTQGYLATVISSQDVIERGDFLAAEIKRIPELTPVAGPKTIEAKLLIDPRYKKQSIAQYQFAFVDRGSSDGITEGMIFRKYIEQDPVNRDSLSQSDLSVFADAQVVKCSPQYSLVKIITSQDTLSDGDDLSLLTDVSSLMGKRQRVTRSDDDDDLDRLDDGKSLNPGEAKELNQLENSEGLETTPPDFEAPSDQAAPEFEAPSETKATPDSQPETEEPPPDFEAPEPAVKPAAKSKK